MKLSQLKILIKEAVKEAIQDELKDILLEDVKSSKSFIYGLERFLQCKNTFKDFAN